MTFKEVLKIAQQQCLDKKIGDQAPLLLLLELSEKEAHNLYMEYDEEMDPKLFEVFQAGIKRLLQNEPLAHILGYEHFYGYNFYVNEDVLIPRPETEELVANVLAAYDEHFKDQKADVIDVGCGSGAIAITLQLEESNFSVAASDISEKALVVAKKNAKNLHANVEFYQGDMLKPFIDMEKKVDILVSNPPYIPAKEKMEKSVLDFEPHVALFGGADGLQFYRNIFQNAHRVLKQKSILAFEMGYDQKDALLKEAKIYFPEDKIEIIKDLNGKNRMLFIYCGLS